MADVIGIIVRLREKRRFIADAKDAERAVTGVGKAADKAGKQTATASPRVEKARKGFLALGRAGLLVGTAVGTAAVLGMRSAVNAASDLGEQISKTHVVFRGAGGAVEAWSRGTAASLGVSQRAALEAAGVFGNMLVPMGLGRREAAAMSQTMVGLGADLASFNNASPEETLDALRSGLAGETEPLRKFGVFLSAARIEQQALAMGLSDGTGELSAAAKAQATYAVILKDTKDAQGDFARTSGGMANQQRIVRAQLENLSATAGRALLPAVSRILGLFIRLVGWGQRNWPAFQAVVSRAWSRVREAIDDVVVWVRRNVVPTIQAIVRYAQAFWRQFGDDIRTVFDFARRHIGRVLDTIRAIVTGVLALLRGDWSTAWESLKTVVRNALAGVLDFLRTVPRLILEVAAKIGAAIARGIGRGIRAAPRMILDALIDILPGPVRKILGLGGGADTGAEVGKALRQVTGAPVGAGAAAGIPAAAAGGVVRSPGRVLVGERGAEVVTLPRAARIDPLPGGEQTIRVQLIVDRRVLAETVARHVSFQGARA